MTDSTLTLVEVQAKITAIRIDITAAESAVSYGKGDKQVARQSLGSLQNQLNKYLRHERELLATAAGAKNSGIVVASWS